MEIALTESLIYLPPLLLAGLLALYKNNILCFWECNPIGVATKEFTGQVAIKMSALLQMARSTAVAIRNFPTSLATIANNTQVMIMNTIQGILVTIKQNILALVLQVKSFIAHLLASFQNYTSYLKNTTLAIFQPIATVKYSKSYLFFAGVGLILCVAIVWYGYQKAKYAPIEEPLPELVEKPVQEPVKEQPIEKEMKKPVRRRSKKSD